jgi:hypothetical protein
MMQEIGGVAQLRKRVFQFRSVHDKAFGIGALIQQASGRLGMEYSPNFE